MRSSFVFNQKVFARSGLQQQADQYNTELFRHTHTHQKIQDMAYITTYNNTNMNPLEISSTLTVAQRLHFGCSTWHIFIHFLFIQCSQPGVNTLTTSFTFADVLTGPDTTARRKIGHFAQCLSFPLSPDKLQPPPRLDTCSFETGTVPRWQIRRRQTPDHPAAPTASRCNQWRGSPRLREDGERRCILTLINRVREGKPSAGDRAWRGGDDKNIITAATAFQVIHNQLCSAALHGSCFSFTYCFTRCIPRARGERVYWKTIYVRVINAGILFRRITDGNKVAACTQ